jgi:F0F1-type ATP synthase assembly protein I
MSLFVGGIIVGIIIGNFLEPMGFNGKDKE